MVVNLNLKPKVKRLMDAFLIDAQKVGIRLLVTQGVRTISEQNELYARGRTAPGKIVTNARGGESLHNFGVAFDVCGFDGKLVHYDIDWNKLASIASKLGLEHGDRGYVDLPHFQFRGGHSLLDFQKNRTDPKKFI